MVISFSVINYVVSVSCCREVPTHFLFLYLCDKSFDMEKDENQMKIEIRPEVAGGSYSNLAVISHSPSEFVLDFAIMLPGVPSAQVSNRIIMTPEHVKRLLAALSDNVSKYEAQFGTIELQNSPSNQGATFNLSDLNPNGTKS